MGEQGRAGKGRAGGQEENASGAMLTCPNENYDYGRLQIISRQDKVVLLSHWGHGQMRTLHKIIWPNWFFLLAISLSAVNFLITHSGGEKQTIGA
jgi:hypothetical protein